MNRQVFNPYLPMNNCIPDGEPHVFGDRIYVYGSHDEEGGTAFCVNDYEVFSAPVDDLTDWRSEGISYRKDQDPDYGRDGNDAMYAPDVVRGNDGRYYLYYAMAGGHFTGPIKVAVSDSPAGPFEYLGAVRNPDGSTFRRNITFDPGVINDDGQIRLYYGWSLTIPKTALLGAGYGKPGFDLRTNPLMQKLKQIEMQMFEKTAEEIDTAPDGIMGANTVELEDDMLTVKGEPKRIVPGNIDAIGTPFEDHAFFEASSIRRIGDTYYFIYSSEQMHELCYATSKYPDRDFVYGGTLVSNGDIGIDGREKKDSLNAVGNDHGSVECINGKWYVFYHRQTHKSSYSRQGLAEPITLTEDGRFLQASITSCGLNGGPLVAEGSYPAPIACVLSNGRMSEWEGDPRTHEGGADIPFITNDGEERFITSIMSGTVAGYRFFDLKKDTTLSLTVRGDFDGKITVSYELPEDIGTEDGQSVVRSAVAEMVLTPSADWTSLSCTLPAPEEIPAEGTAVYLTFHGRGNAEFKELSFR